MADNDGFIPLTKKKKVEVVVFQDPAKISRMKAMQNKRNKAKPSRPTKYLSKRSETTDSTEDLDFKSAFEDVKDFGITGFSKKERKRMEQQKAQSLGAWKPKGLKVPYPILQDLVKKKKEKEKNRIEMEKAMGIFKKKKRETKQTKTIASGWWVDRPMKIDRSSNNVRLKSSDIKAINKKAIR